MDFDEVADQLYSLPPPQFTAARDAAAQRAGQSDDDLAEAVRGLRRPTLGAWLANLLVREHRTESQALLELGDELRAAQDGLAGERLRELTAGRRAVVGALVQQARAAAVRAGLPVGEGPLADLEQTLTTVLADRTAAEAFAAGRLTKPLTPHSPVEPAPARPAASAPTRQPASPTGADPDESARARRGLKEAERQSAAAARAATAARRELDRAAERHRRAHSGAEELSARLDRARAAERTAAEQERTLRTKVETTDRDARRAAGRARDAAVRVRHLDNRRIRDAGG